MARKDESCFFSAVCLGAFLLAIAPFDGAGAQTTIRTLVIVTDAAIAEFNSNPIYKQPMGTFASIEDYISENIQQMNDVLDSRGMGEQIVLAGDPILGNIEVLDQGNLVPYSEGNDPGAPADDFTETDNVRINGLTIATLRATRYADTIIVVGHSDADPDAAAANDVGSELGSPDVFAIAVGLITGHPSYDDFGIVWMHEFGHLAAIYHEYKELVEEHLWTLEGDDCGLCGFVKRFSVFSNGILNQTLPLISDYQPDPPSGGGGGGGGFPQVPSEPYFNAIPIECTPEVIPGFGPACRFMITWWFDEYTTDIRFYNGYQPMGYHPAWWQPIETDYIPPWAAWSWGAAACNGYALCSNIVPVLW